MEVFENSILGYEVVDWLIRHLHISRREANVVATDLFTGVGERKEPNPVVNAFLLPVGLIVPVVKGMPFVDGFSFYRWNE